jgi:hypothetical protein
MRQIGSFKIGTGNAEAQMPKIRAVPDFGATALGFELHIKPRNRTGAPADYTVGRLKAALGRLWGNHYAAIGEGAESDVFDNATTFPQARRLLATLTDDDVLVNGARLDSFAGDATAIQAGVAAGAVANEVVVFIPRALYVQQVERDGRRVFGLGGWQLMHLDVKCTPVGAFDGTDVFEQNSDVECVVLVEEAEERDIKLARPARVRRLKDGTSLKHNGPSEACAVLALYETSKTGTQTIAGAGGTLGRFTIGRRGDRNLHTEMRASVVAQANRLQKLPGAYDTEGEATCLYRTPQAVEINEIPTGAGWFIDMPGAELDANAYAFEWVIIPAWDEVSTHRAGITLHKREEFPPRFAIVSSGPTLGLSVAQSAASILPLYVVFPGDARFEVGAGFTYARGKAPSLHVPAAALRKIAAELDAHEGASSDAVASSIVKALAKVVPGGASAVKGETTAVRVALADYVGRSVKKLVRVN